MKKIVPFSNTLTFPTDLSEITAISLEPTIKKESDLISGNFNISGEYKITDGMLPPEKFNFDLPFDIALGLNYNVDTMTVDVDDFNYEVLNNNQMKVNIDISIDGEEEINDVREENIVEPTIDINHENEELEIKEDNQNQDILLSPTEENYVTYRVYRVNETDSLDDILKKYNISKEEVAKYNDLETINPGDKLIIPANQNDE